MFAAITAFAPTPVFAAGGSDVKLDRAPVNRHDINSVQRGAAAFTNYCMGCHSASYMRYGRLAEDLHLDPEQVAMLSFGVTKAAAPMVSAMPQEQAKEWFNQAAPPDLTLVARSRGADWLYTFLRGFYRDSSRPSGWNNRVFPNTAMPHVLYTLQGSAQHGADGAVSAPEGGRLSPGEYDVFATDLVNFLVYAGEPARNLRIRTGFAVMIFMLILLPLTYALYREYWRDIR